MPSSFDLSWEQVPYGPFNDRLWWVLIALCFALLLTVQGIETALEGSWPHQRRSSRLVPRERSVQLSWSVVALLVIPAALLLIGIVSLTLWQHPPMPDYARIGIILTVVGWGLFLVFSLERRWVGRLFTNLGLIGPAALIILLMLGNLLLLSTFLDIVPTWSTLLDAIEHGLRNILPFVD